jgi:AhpD family alkylhydroperoxidase
MSQPAPRLPHLPRVDDADATEEVAALYTRARQKLGAATLPAALRSLAGSPVVFRDMMLNLERTLHERPPLARAERLLVGLGVAAAAGAPDLAHWLDGLAQAHGIPVTDRRSAIEVALVCRTLNAYYRAKSLMDVPGPGLDSHANLRATPLVSSPLAKSTVEMVCTAVSVLTNCRSCVTAHARSAIEAGATQPQLDEVVRVQAVVVGLAVLEG